VRIILAFALVFVSACATPGHQHTDVEDVGVVAFQAPVEIMRSAPALSGPGYTAPTFQFTCGTSALRISPPTGDVNYNIITVWNAACSGGTCTASATPVFLGGRYDSGGNLLAAVTTDTGMPICSGSGCIGTFATYELRNLQCIAGSSVTVTAQVMR